MKRALARLNLFQQFILASLVVLLANMVAVGWWVGRQIEAGVVNRTAATTALFVDSFVSPQIQELGRGEPLSFRHAAILDERFRETTLGRQIVAFNIWDPTGRIVYSTDQEHVGLQFPIQAQLARALEGHVASKISDLEEPEHSLAPEGIPQLIETYSPIRATGTNRVIAAAEFYQKVDDLRQDIVNAQVRSWLIVASATLITYLLLAVIVRGGSTTIRYQQLELQTRIRQLSRVLDQNDQLHDRVRRAATRTTALNERFLRRISAELHDGPAQDLGLALLKLDDVVDGTGHALDTTRGSLERALQDLRTIAAGLRLPELENLTLPASLERVVRLHERRTETKAELTMESLPDHAALPVKITLYRLVQEALANAYRHGKGVDQKVRVKASEGHLQVEISDGGPGFEPGPFEERDGHLGVPGMRERVESLGGIFTVVTGPGKGVRVKASIPLVPTPETD